MGRSGSMARLRSSGRHGRRVLRHLQPVAAVHRVVVHVRHLPLDDVELDGQPQRLTVRESAAPARCSCGGNGRSPRSFQRILDQHVLFDRCSQVFASRSRRDATPPPPWPACRVGAAACCSRDVPEPGVQRAATAGRRDTVRTASKGQESVPHACCCHHPGDLSESCSRVALRLADSLKSAVLTNPPDRYSQRYRHHPTGDLKENRESSENPDQLESGTPATRRPRDDQIRIGCTRCGIVATCTLGQPAIQRRRHDASAPGLAHRASRRTTVRRQLDASAALPGGERQTSIPAGDRQSIPALAVTLPHGGHACATSAVAAHSNSRGCVRPLPPPVGIDRGEQHGELIATRRATTSLPRHRSSDGAALAQHLVARHMPELDH